MPAAVVTDEVQRQRKRRLSRARKEQERDLLRPATAMQPPGRSIRFDDPALGVLWGLQHPILSAKDQNAPLLAESDVRFIYPL